jgi:NAD kinase
VDKGDVNFLTSIDFSQIDEMDPNVFNGHKAIFDSDIELEVRILEDNGNLSSSIEFKQCYRHDR